MSNLMNFRGESFAAEFDFKVKGYRVNGSVNASSDLKRLDLTGEVHIEEGGHTVNFNCFRREENTRANIYNLDLADAAKMCAVISEAEATIENNIKAAIGGE